MYVYLIVACATHGQHSEVYGVSSERAWITQWVIFTIIYNLSPGTRVFAQPLLYGTGYKITVRSVDDRPRPGGQLTSRGSFIKTVLEWVSAMLQRLGGHIALMSLSPVSRANWTRAVSWGPSWTLCYMHLMAIATHSLSISCRPTVLNGIPRTF